MTNHERKKEIRDKRTQQWEREAMNSLTAEALLFGRSYMPIREIRDRLDPILKAHEIREITKINVEEEEDGDK
jgi:hypothetical protein